MSSYMPLRIMLAGGGTGGHIYPAITIADALREAVPSAQVIFVGSRRGLEKDVVPKAGYELITLDVQGLSRKISWRNAIAVWKAAVGLWGAAKAIRKFRPDVVVGTGGYVSGSVVLMASLLGIPTMIQEQNVIPGITNRILSRRVKVVAISYEESRRFFPASAKVRLTGNPIRPSIMRATRARGIAALRLDPSCRTLLVFGGSQGSLAINRAMLSALPKLLKIPRLQIVHQTGRTGYDEVSEQVRGLGLDAESLGRLKIMPYIYNMEDALAASDLVIGRAGAISISEITARGIPAILIPFPSAAANHQERNARALEEAGAAVMILERELSGERLANTVKELLSDPARLSGMAAASKALGKPEATGEIINLILDLARGKRR